MPVVLSPRARADLGAIWDYTAERWGQEQAERYVRQIQAALEALADNPGLGRDAGDIRAGYRRYPCGAHVIFCRLSGGGTVDVVRILHQRMDVRRHL